MRGLNWGYVLDFVLSLFVMFQFIPGAVVLLLSDQLACSAQTKVREARFVCSKLSLAVFGCFRVHMHE